MNYYQDVKGFILNELVADKLITSIEPETPLSDLIDSLNMVKLIVFIEDKLKVDLLANDVDMKDFQSLNGIMNLINRSMERMVASGS